jgi:hypothetical protein
VVLLIAVDGADETFCRVQPPPPVVSASTRRSSTSPIVRS